MTYSESSPILALSDHFPYPIDEIQDAETGLERLDSRVQVLGDFPMFEERLFLEGSNEPVARDARENTRVSRETQRDERLGEEGVNKKCR
jgi:hypothetical protein